jgi:hypothetical protein
MDRREAEKLRLQKLRDEQRKQKKLKAQKLKKLKQQKTKLAREAKLQAKREGRRTGFEALLFGKTIATAEEKSQRVRSIFRIIGGRHGKIQTEERVKAEAEARAKKAAIQAAANRRLGEYAVDPEAYERDRAEVTRRREEAAGSVTPEGRVRSTATAVKHTPRNRGFE